MSFNAVRKALVLGAALGAMSLAGTASAATLHGVVVQHNRLSHSFVLALGKGRLVSIHAHRSPALGRVVTVRARLLRNGTYALRHVSARDARKHRVRIHGVVTFVKRSRGEFTVSAGGASLLIRPARTSGHAGDVGTSAGLPSVGEEVDVEAQLDGQGDLEDQNVQNDGTQTQNVRVEGTILAIDATASTLTISADGEDQSGQSIVVDVPPTIDITQFQVGDEVQLAVSLQPDGSFLLQGSSEDGNSGQANNQGDQQGCEGQGPGNTCSGSGSSGSGSQGGDNSGSGNSGSDGSGSGGNSSGNDSSGTDSSGSQLSSSPGSDSSGT